MTTKPAQIAQSIMENFSLHTGLVDTDTETNNHHPERYLWTDAFAVCNFLELYRQHREPRLMKQALALVDQVHRVLGQHRLDSNRRSGANKWLSGLADEQALQHPTRGGLRIGKPLDERQSGASNDPSLEWQQDGQYFHYLTKWMHALSLVSCDTGDSKYNRWAIELAKTASAAFIYEPRGSRVKRMYWKMSIDLSRPLVASMGLHDPLDGYLTFLQLDACAKRFSDTSVELSLKHEIADLASICEGQSLTTEDSLGIGGLLCDAYKLFQLITAGQLDAVDWLKCILKDIDQSLSIFFRHEPFSLPASYRLAFRELGLAIGLQAIPKMQGMITQLSSNEQDQREILALLTSISKVYPWHKVIEQFWLKPEHQAIESWQQHANINSVMLASSLVPGGYLELC